MNRRSRPTRGLWAFLLAGGIGSRATGQATTSGARVGVVRTAAGVPIPFADVSIDGRHAIFTDDGGRFRFDPAGAATVTIRARRLGFKPDTATVDLRAVRDTLRITLTELRIELAKARVSRDACPLRGDGSDTLIVAIVQQAQLAAQRGAAFADEFPYTLRMERSLGYARPGSDRLHVKNNSIYRVDTNEVAGVPDWHYAPGQLVGPIETDDRGNNPHASMKLPQLADFASDAFASAHCLRFGGYEAGDGAEWLRVDFVPAPGLRTPDVSGSLYLDAKTFALRRSSMSIEVRQPQGVWTTYVETTFREVRPGVAVIATVSQLTYTRDGHGATVPRVAVEDQRVIDVTFLDRQP